MTLAFLPGFDDPGSACPQDSPHQRIRDSPHLLLLVHNVFFLFCGSWPSLYQEHGPSGAPGRTNEQYASFQRALRNTMDLWYAHTMIVVYMLTTLPDGVEVALRQYDQRGWTTYERCLAELIKPVRPYFNNSQFEHGCYLWPMCVEVCAAEGSGSNAHSYLHQVVRSRRVLTAPDQFDELVQAKEFTNGADKGMVADLYRKHASALLASTKKLDQDGVLCQRGDGIKLASALEACGQNLTRLLLRNMHLSDLEFAPVAAAMRPSNGRLGAPMASLQLITLIGNELGDKSCVALTAALPWLPSLERLIMCYNRIGNHGLTALATALEYNVSCSPNIMELQLDGNIYDDSAAELAVAKLLPIRPRLAVLLKLGWRIHSTREEGPSGDTMVGTSHHYRQVLGVTGNGPEDTLANEHDATAADIQLWSEMPD
uniref:Uncharacterized protein n=1 Tax=Haptolina brevifila TaxID=156173 RepID=A0A6U7LBG0_9EUKA|mmetsp:Transcript_72909/g.144915  ORF Transcript_72909/g.144915 Transcript_72909/m.144915 type:complete len:428 (+) Transcript_72909:1212-2495(+)